MSALCERFLAALERLHWQRAPALRAALALGYALHLDATCDKGKGGTFLCLDGLRNWVLHAVKIASENESALRPAVEHTLAVFGDPLATVRDLGSAIAKTVAATTHQRGIPDLLCHYHFLVALGKRLLDQDYARLRDRLARSGLRSHLRELLRATREPAQGLREDLPALLLWLLEGTAHKHPSYPFALPHLDFYLRCAAFPAQRDRRLPTPRTPREQQVLRQVESALADLRSIQRPAPAAQRLQHRWELFCELRDVLRLSAQDLPHGQSPAPASPSADAQAETLQALAADLKRYHQALRQRVQDLPDNSQPDPPEALLLDYLDRYGEQLCGHPAVRAPSGPVVAVVARTNNVLEQFFATPSRACAAVSGGPIWGATWKTSRPRQPSSPTCATPTMCASCAALSTGCPKPLPPWNGHSPAIRRACSATIAMPLCGGAIGLGRKKLHRLRPRHQAHTIPPQQQVCNGILTR